MSADETPAELRARLTNEERAEGRRDLTFPWNGPWRSWLLKHGEALLDAADDVTRLEAERDALLARLAAAEEENDELHEDLVRMMQERNAAIARLTAAEADADRLRSGLRYTLAWFDASTLAEFRRDASGQSLYDEVAVLRERPQ
jgi:hypothetical protein